MSIARIVGFIGAAVFHGGILLFGGILWLGGKSDHGSLAEVDLLAPEAEKDKPKEEKQEPKEELQPETTKAPDSAELLHNLETPPEPSAPALDAASLGEIENALFGHGAAGGDFAEAMSFASGGRINGTGRPGTGEDKADNAFNLTEIDQKPQPVYQPPPMYPTGMRGKKIEGVVTIVFVVDATGRVADPRVEKSTHADFDRPALDAIRQWKFEPAVKAGQRVACRMRAPIRFQPS
jgi:protein TonB